MNRALVVRIVLNVVGCADSTLLLEEEMCWLAHNVSAEVAVAGRT